MTLIIWGIIVVVISVSINVFIMSAGLLKLFKEVLDYYEKYLKRFILIEIITRGILEEKNKQALLELLKEEREEMEE